jgi:hypothetical protein
MDAKLLSTSKPTSRVPTLRRWHCGSTVRSWRWLRWGALRDDHRLDDAVWSQGGPDMSFLIHQGLERLWAGRAKACLPALLLWSAPGEAQTASPELRHVRWPLLDIVILPDSSAGVWLMVAPSPATKEWEGGAPVVSMAIDPVVALQWATLARGLTGANSSDLMPNAVDRLTPPLRDRRGPEFLVLANNRRKTTPEEALVLVVSDSRSHTRWKTFASPAQVDTLLNALEITARQSRVSFVPGAADGEDSVDTPVHVVAIPRPKYPPKLLSKVRVGRVWMMYVVGADGRAEPASFRPLLADDPSFVRAAIVALVHAKYQPARVDGHPVPQRVFQVVTFRMP